jgi:RND family efflux transporter MFP subunit
MPRIAGLVLLSLAAAGCKNGQPPPPPPKTPEVLVSLPLVREVTDYETFTGRTEASKRVDLRARVTGYLSKAGFAEGADVRAGDLLFVIDPRVYQAEVTRAEAAVAQAEAAERRAENDFLRYQDLVKRDAASREDFNRMIGDRETTRAAVKVTRAQLELAKLSLQFTEVRAPFAGRVSRRMIDPGNLVKADDTILTTLVATEPMYAYFDVDERTLLKQLLDSGLLASAQGGKVKVQVGLADEAGFPHSATVNFVDNKLDPSTGTIWMRAVFDRPNRPVSAGMFVRVRFPLGGAYRAVQVAEQAVGTDQGQKYVYVVDNNNKIAYRQVQVGRLHDGLRVIRDGVKPGERVVISGLQRVRPGAEVAPKVVDMPIRAAKKNGDKPAPTKPAVSSRS